MIYYRQYKTQTQGGIAGDFLENGIFFSFFGGNVFKKSFLFTSVCVDGSGFRPPNLGAANGLYQKIF